MIDDVNELFFFLFLQIFLENNGRVDVFDHEGKSALHLAAENGSIEVCEALLTRNAFINSKTKARTFESSRLISRSMKH